MELRRSLVIQALFLLAVTSVTFVKAQKTPITLDDVLQGKLSAAGFSGGWADGSDELIRMRVGDTFVDYNVTDGESDTALDLSPIRVLFPLFSGNVIFSSDGKFALVEHDRVNLWRYSSLAKYDIFELATNRTAPLIPTGETVQPRLQLVKWAPSGYGIAFVWNNNIYYRKDVAAGTTVWQITRDGSHPEDEEFAVYNGIADWVYEEEMFGGPTALWISKDGTNLAFVRFDDTQVTEFQWPVYGEPGTENSYPEYRNIRYPKAGTTNNPDVKLFTVALAAENTAPVEVTYASTPGPEHIIGTVAWATGNQLLVSTMNRIQTSAKWHLCTVGTACASIHNYTLTKGWVDMNTPVISSNGSVFLWTESVKLGNDPLAYNRIVMFRAGQASRTISTGSLSVTSILGWDHVGEKIYFAGSLFNGGPADATESHVYSVSEDGNGADQTCITCALKNGAGNDCRSNSVTFSANYVNFIHRCSGPDVPETTTRKTSDGTPVPNPGPTLIDNAALRTNLAAKSVPTVKVYDNITVGDFQATAWLWFPENYDERQKYPLLVAVYGGPGSQNLNHNYGVGWETSLVSDKKIIVAKIDGRGTSKKSTDHMFSVHQALGGFEMQDQISVTKWLIENVPQIDEENTSIWGWSYGGYATAKVLELDTENVFKCGISVAPVTRWIYYDTIYTERYMGTPTTNPTGYNSSDVTTHVDNLANKKFMLVHGNADDNVHYQQSMVLARALEKKDIFFHQLSYPDENHSIGSVRLHLYHSLERFLFDECFAAPEAPAATTQAGAGVTSASVLAVIASFTMLMARYV